MAKKKKTLILDEGLISEDFFEHSGLLGIQVPFDSFQFCWKLNDFLGYNFKATPPFEIELRRKNRKYFFPIFESKKENVLSEHLLYSNQYDGEYLLPEYKHIDFIWKIKNENNKEEIMDFLKFELTMIEEIQVIIDIAVDNLKSKSNLIF
jgi:hypothetical protein